jgi:hypothetical protein
MALSAGQAKLFDVHEHVGGIGINAECARTLQFRLRISAGQESHAESAFAYGSEQIPFAVAHNNAVVDFDMETMRGLFEDVRGRLGFFDVISGYDWHSSW